MSRRGLSILLHSDNGSNFKGSNNDLCELYHFLAADSTQRDIKAYLLNHRISRTFSPECAPHFGGLWEAAVKSAKQHSAKLKSFTRFLARLRAAQTVGLFSPFRVVLQMEFNNRWNATILGKMVHRILATSSEDSKM